MSQSTFDKMNLRPQERRLVVVVGVVIFAVLNIWFVWPYFDDWGQVGKRMTKSRETLRKYQQEIARRPVYEENLAQLKLSGSRMLTSEVEMQNIINSIASSSGIQILNYDPRFKPAFAKTNQFFEEQTATLRFNSDGEELVNFLVGVAAQDAMIRVREMTVRSDPAKTRLTGSLVLVGNYQKQTSSPERVASARPRR